MDQVFEGLVKRFELAAGAAVIIDGGEARDAEIPEEIEADLRLLDSF
jgi:hypothetical protein